MPDEVVTAPVAAASVEAAAPAASVPVAATEAAPTAPSVETPAAAAPEAAAPAAPEAPKTANDFQPSLLDSATQPESAPAPQEGPSEAKPADAKTDAPGETPPAPINYAFTYPEGFDPSTVNAERMSAYTGILGDAKVAPEVGQKLLDMHLSEGARIAEAIAQKQWDVFNETQNRWRSEVMAHPDLGGANHNQAISTIMSLVEQYGGNAEERKGLLDAFRITGAANNPHVLAFLHRAGKALSREGVPHPAPPPRLQPADPRQRRMNSRYGSTTPLQQPG